MKEKLNELADALNAAVASDTPRATMNAVANQLRVLAAAVSGKRHGALTPNLIVPMFYRKVGAGDGRLYLTEPTQGVPKDGEGLYTLEQVQELL